MHARTFIKGARTLAAAAILSIASVASAHADDITGAGATFPAPIYTRWGEAFAGQGGASLNYQGVGSGAASRKLTAPSIRRSDAPVVADRRLRPISYNSPPSPARSSSSPTFPT